MNPTTKRATQMKLGGRNEIPSKDKWPPNAQVWDDPVFLKINNGKTWVWGDGEWIRSTRPVEEVQELINTHIKNFNWKD
jgi:hypothetical protein